MAGSGALAARVGEPTRPFKEEKCDSSNEGDVFVTGKSCSCSTHIKGSAVHIEEGLANGDKLECKSCTSLGIKTEYTNGKLHLNNDKPFSVYAEALASVEFTASTAGTRKITMNYGHALYSRKNQHFYSYSKYTECVSQNKKRVPPYQKKYDGATWVEAQTCCADKSNDIFGLAGYLMTITTADEQAIAVSKLDGRGWMGASDAGYERTWKWVTGPEGCAPYDLSHDGPERTSCDIFPYKRRRNYKSSCRGNQCRKGTLIGYQKRSNGFRAANGMYTNWKQNEPNEYCYDCPGDCKTAGEDFAHFYDDGVWNDYPNYHEIEGYMCEWGGIGERCINEAHLSREIEITGEVCNPNDSPAGLSIVDPDSGVVVKQQSLDVTLGMNVWSGATLSFLPKYLTPIFSSTQVAVAFTSNHVDAGKVFRLTCPETCSDKKCDFYITHYLCPPCESENGRLPASLMSSGWGPGSCAPRFTEGSDQHRMVAFRRRLSPGETLDIPELESDLEKYVIFGITQVESCSEAVGETECDARSGCSWKGSSCLNDWCPKPTGPASGDKCLVCAKFK